MSYCKTILQKIEKAKEPLQMFVDSFNKPVPNNVAEWFSNPDSKKAGMDLLFYSTLTSYFPSVNFGDQIAEWKKFHIFEYWLHRQILNNFCLKRVPNPFDTGDDENEGFEEPSNFVSNIVDPIPLLCEILTEFKLTDELAKLFQEFSVLGSYVRANWDGDNDVSIQHNKLIELKNKILDELVKDTSFQTDILGDNIRSVGPNMLAMFETEAQAVERRVATKRRAEEQKEAKRQRLKSRDDRLNKLKKKLF